MTDIDTNPIGLRGIAFTEFSGTDEHELDTLFKTFGFSRVHKHNDLEIDHWSQNDIHFLLSRTEDGFAADFRKAHGPSICAMGWFVDNAVNAKRIAVERGARPADDVKKSFDLPAVYGIGDSLIYFVDESTPIFTDEFSAHPNPISLTPKGFLVIDHLTNNVHKGSMEKWSNFYKDIFGFTDLRSFDIDGAKTGLLSYALQSPDGSFCIPINEAKDDKSQIAEYLRDYDGEGIQHIAFLSKDLVASMDLMKGESVEFLDIDDEYYENVYDRVPNVTEDRTAIKDHQILVDGDENGYLLQIFTRNVVGPIFIELIQRKNNNSFGEGNFGALFRSIERDQERRGVL